MTDQLVVAIIWWPWKRRTCSYRLPLCTNLFSQNWQKCGRSSPCMCAWLRSWETSENVLPQSAQRYGRSLMWCDMCTFSSQARCQILPQTLQRNGQSLGWYIWTCFRSSRMVENFCPSLRHLKRLSPLWVHKWRFRLPRHMYSRPHSGHL